MLPYSDAGRGYWGLILQSAKHSGLSSAKYVRGASLLKQRSSPTEISGTRLRVKVKQLFACFAGLGPECSVYNRLKVLVINNVLFCSLLLSYPAREDVKDPRTLLPKRDYHLWCPAQDSLSHHNWILCPSPRVSWCGIFSGCRVCRWSDCATSV